MKELDIKSVESSELVEQTFKFWFGDSDHIRSPFPTGIRPQLQIMATNKFFKWATQLDNKAKDELDDESVASKFEEIIFETAMNMVDTEDEKLTINYPFLPRLGDNIFENAEDQTGESEVVERFIVQKKDSSYLALRLKKVESGKEWETKFELPVPLD